MIRVKKATKKVVEKLIENPVDIWNYSISDVLFMSNDIIKYGSVDLFCEMIARLLIGEDCGAETSWKEEIDIFNKLISLYKDKEEKQDPNIQVLEGEKNVNKYSRDQALVAISFMKLYCITLLYYESSEEFDSSKNEITRVNKDTVYTDKDPRINGTVEAILNRKYPDAAAALLTIKPEQLFNKNYKLQGKRGL